MSASLDSLIEQARPVAAVIAAYDQAVALARADFEAHVAQAREVAEVALRQLGFTGATHLPRPPITMTLPPADSPETAAVVRAIAEAVATTPPHPPILATVEPPVPYPLVPFSVLKERGYARVDFEASVDAAREEGFQAAGKWRFRPGYGHRPQTLKIVWQRDSSLGWVVSHRLDGDEADGLIETWRQSPRGWHLVSGVAPLTAEEETKTDGSTTPTNSPRPPHREGRTAEDRDASGDAPGADSPAAHLGADLPPAGDLSGPDNGRADGSESDSRAGREPGPGAPPSASGDPPSGGPADGTVPADGGTVPAPGDPLIETTAHPAPPMDHPFSESPEEVWVCPAPDCGYVGKPRWSTQCKVCQRHKHNLWAAERKSDTYKPEGWSRRKQTGAGMAAVSETASPLEAPVDGITARCTANLRAAADDAIAEAGTAPESVDAEAITTRLRARIRAAGDLAIAEAAVAALEAPTRTGAGEGAEPEENDETPILLPSPEALGKATGYLSGLPIARRLSQSLADALNATIEAGIQQFKRRRFDVHEGPECRFYPVEIFTSPPAGCRRVLRINRQGEAVLPTLLHDWQPKGGWAA